MSVEQRKGLESMLRASKSLMSPGSVQDMRDFMERTMGALPPHPDATRRPAQGAPVDSVWFEVPGAAADACLLYFHGGAYFMGSTETHAPLTSRLAVACGMPCLSINYRLAPEHKFPAQLEDAIASYRWLLDQGIPAQRIAFAGDSAGGGLTLSALCGVRDAGLPLPGAAVAISPWTDLEGTGESMKTKNETEPMLRAEDVPRYAHMFMGHGNLRDPRASPLHADLRGLPPLLIHVGDNEILLDDAVRFAERGKEAGVEVTLEVGEDLFHVWHIFACMLEEGQEAVEAIGRFVREKLGIPSLQGGAV